MFPPPYHWFTMPNCKISALHNDWIAIISLIYQINKSRLEEGFFTENSNWADIRRYVPKVNIASAIIDRILHASGSPTKNYHVYMAIIKTIRCLHRTHFKKFRPVQAKPSERQINGKRQSSSKLIGRVFVRWMGPAAFFPNEVPPKLVDSKCSTTGYGFVPHQNISTANLLHRHENDSHFV